MILRSRTWVSLSVLVLGIMVRPTRSVYGQELESPEKKVEMNTERQAPSPQPAGVKEIHVPVKKHNWLMERAEDFGGDQKELWTSPRNLRFSDTAWLVPISGLTAGLF